MRIEINSGGIGNGVSVMEFQSGFENYLSSADSIISCFKTVKNETSSLSGGVSSLQTALDYIDSRLKEEENVRENAVETGEKANSFFSLAQRVDNQVASNVKQNRDEFYSVNSWAKPTPSTEGKKWYERAWDWLCDRYEDVKRGFKAVGNTAKKIWNSIVDFYNEHKKVINTILIVVGAVAAIVAVFLTGGTALAALVPLLTAIGIPAGAASVISAIVGVGAILSTIASSSMNIYDVWYDVDDPTFNAWQKGLNITSVVLNITYSIGGVYNSIKGYKLFSRIDWTGYPEGAPKPKGFYRLLDGDEYDAARKIANGVNNSLHRGNPSLAGLQIHEIHPVKFGGSPSSLLNKLFLTPEEHSKYTVFWNLLMKGLK